MEENTLGDPALVTDDNCEEYLFSRGKGWVCLTGDVVVGFSIVDIKGKKYLGLVCTTDYEKRNWKKIAMIQCLSGILNKRKEMFGLEQAQKS